MLRADDQREGARQRSRRPGERSRQPGDRSRRAPPRPPPPPLGLRFCFFFTALSRICNTVFRAAISQCHASKGPANRLFSRQTNHRRGPRARDKRITAASLTRAVGPTAPSENEQRCQPACEASPRTQHPIRQRLIPLTNRLKILEHTLKNPFLVLGP